MEVILFASLILAVVINVVNGIEKTSLSNRADELQQIENLEEGPFADYDFSLRPSGFYLDQFCQILANDKNIETGGFIKDSQAGYYCQLGTEDDEFDVYFSPCMEKPSDLLTARTKDIISQIHELDQRV